MFFYARMWVPLYALHQLGLVCLSMHQTAQFFLAKEGELGKFMPNPLSRGYKLCVEVDVLNPLNRGIWYIFHLLPCMYVCTAVSAFDLAFRGGTYCNVLLCATSNKNFILKYFRCRDGKRTETRIGMEGICITHSCIPLYTVYMQHIMAHSSGMQEWVIQIPSIPILVSVLFPSLHLKYFRIKFLLLVCIVFMCMCTKPHPHPVIS